jgi:16S rRNA (cytosine1402-N4)-methyltransferase
MALLESTDADVLLLGIDRDPEALERARARLAPFGARVSLARGSFRSLEAIARDHDILTAQSILLDLGMSSYQVDESGRGAASRSRRTSRSTCASTPPRGRPPPIS